MLAKTPETNPGIYLLGDHLDAALAMGEDLLTEKVALADPVETVSRAHALRQSREFGEFLSGVRALELTLIGRLLQARRRTEELRRQESRLKPLIALFVAGTAPLVDAAAELGDTTMHDFNTGDTASAYLRNRGLIARDAAGFEQQSQLAVSEEFLVAGRIRLGTLLDLIATFLDTLDVMFDLFQDPLPATGLAGPSPLDAAGRAT